MLLNPTKHYVMYRLFDPLTESSIPLTKEMILDPYYISINNGTEFERGTIKHDRDSNKIIIVYLGVYKIEAYVWKDEPEDKDFTTSDIHCTTELIQIDTDKALDDPENYIFTTGSIFTFLVTVDDDEQYCNVKYDQDALGNTVNIFTLLPQYVVITMGEVT